MPVDTKQLGQAAISDTFNQWREKYNELITAFNALPRAATGTLDRLGGTIDGDATATGAALSGATGTFGTLWMIAPTGGLAIGDFLSTSQPNHITEQLEIRKSTANVTLSIATGGVGKYPRLFLNNYSYGDHVISELTNEYLRFGTTTKLTNSSISISGDSGTSVFTANSEQVTVNGHVTVGRRLIVDGVPGSTIGKFAALTISNPSTGDGPKALELYRQGSTVNSYGLGYATSTLKYYTKHNHIFYGSGDPATPVYSWPLATINTSGVFANTKFTLDDDTFTADSTKVESTGQGIFGYDVVAANPNIKLTGAVVTAAAGPTSLDLYARGATTNAYGFEVGSGVVNQYTKKNHVFYTSQDISSPPFSWRAATVNSYGVTANTGFTTYDKIVRLENDDFRNTYLASNSLNSGTFWVAGAAGAGQPMLTVNSTSTTIGEYGSYNPFLRISAGTVSADANEPTTNRIKFGSGELWGLGIGLTTKEGGGAAAGGGYSTNFITSRTATSGKDDAFQFITKDSNYTSVLLKANSTSLYHNSGGTFTELGTGGEVPQTMWIPAGGMYESYSVNAPSIAFPYSDGSVETPTVQVRAFAYNTANTTLEFDHSFGPGWTSSTDQTITAKFYYWSNTHVTGTKKVKWAIRSRGYLDAEGVDLAFGNWVDLLDDVTTGDDDTHLHITAATAAFTPPFASTISADSQIIFQISRFGADPQDTLDGDALLSGVKLTYNTNLSDD